MLFYHWLPKADINPTRNKNILIRTRKIKPFYLIECVVECILYIYSICFIHQNIFPDREQLKNRKIRFYNRNNNIDSFMYYIYYY